MVIGSSRDTTVSSCRLRSKSAGWENSQRAYLRSSLSRLFNSSEEAETVVVRVGEEKEYTTWCICLTVLPFLWYRSFWPVFQFGVVTIPSCSMVTSGLIRAVAGGTCWFVSAFRIFSPVTRVRLRETWSPPTLMIRLTTRVVTAFPTRLDQCLRSTWYFIYLLNKLALGANIFFPHDYVEWFY